MILEILHKIAEVCYFIDPFIMIIACAMWMKLYSSMRSECNRMYLRQYGLEMQVDHLVSVLRRQEVDPEYIKVLNEMHHKYSK